MNTSTTKDSPSSSAGSERLPKRQKLETPASSSNSDTTHLAEMERDPLKLKLKALQLELSKSQDALATAVKNENSQKQKQELLEKAKTSVEVELQCAKVTIIQMQEDMEASLRRSREARSAQLNAESKLARLKAIVEHQFDEFMMDWIATETSTSLGFQGDAIKTEKDIKCEEEASEKTDQSTQGGKTSVEAKEKPARKLKAKPTLPENIVGYVDLTQESENSVRTCGGKKSEQIRGQGGLGGKSNGSITCSRVTVSPCQQSKVLMVSEDVKPDVDDLREKNRELQKKIQENGKASAGETSKEPAT